MIAHKWNKTTTTQKIDFTPTCRWIIWECQGHKTNSPHVVDKLPFTGSFIISGASEHAHVWIVLFHVWHCNFLSISKDTRKNKYKPHQKFGPCVAASVTGTSDTLTLLLSIIMTETGGMNYHLTRFTATAFEKSNLCPRYRWQKTWDSIKPNLCSNCLLFLLKDRANYVWWRSAMTMDSQSDVQEWLLRELPHLRMLTSHFDFAASRFLVWSCHWNEEQGGDH